jgi:hypothetical protein
VYLSFISRCNIATQMGERYVIQIKETLYRIVSLEPRVFMLNGQIIN